jgi:hypothetical protein
MGSLASVPQKPEEQDPLDDTEHDAFFRRELKKQYAERALSISEFFSNAAQYITDLDDPSLRLLTDKIDKAYGICHGIPVLTMIRMTLLEAIEITASKARTRFDKTMVSAVSEEFFLQSLRLDSDDVRTAIDIWGKLGAPRSGAKEPRKWEHLSGMMERAGLGKVTAGSLQQEWNTWKKKRVKR